MEQCAICFGRIQMTFQDGVYHQEEQATCLGATSRYNSHTTMAWISLLGLINSYWKGTRSCLTIQLSQSGRLRITVIDAAT